MVKYRDFKIKVKYLKKISLIFFKIVSVLHTSAKFQAGASMGLRDMKQSIEKTSKRAKVGQARLYNSPHHTVIIEL